MSDDHLILEAARDLRRSLNLDFDIAQRSVEKRVRQRRRSRRLVSGSVAAILVAAVFIAAWALRNPADDNVVAGPAATTEAADPSPSTTPSTVPSTTSAPSSPSTAAPVTETTVVRVETLLGDIFDLTVPRKLASLQPRVLHYPSPVEIAPGAALDVRVEPGPAEQVVQIQCQNPVGPPGCVPTEQTDLGGVNTFVRWRLTRPDGSIQGGSAPELATVSNGEWTVLLAGPDFDEARRVAEGLTISTSETGGPRLSYDDPALRSLPRPRGDVSLILHEAPEGFPISVTLSHDCSSLASLEPVNDPGRECVDGVGVRVSGDPTLVAELRSVLRIHRVA